MNSITWGSVQYFPDSYFRRNQMIAVTKLMGDSTKKSPCFFIQSRFRPSMIVLEDSVASVISSIVAGSSGLHRCERERSSKLMTKNLGLIAYCRLLFNRVL